MTDRLFLICLCFSCSKFNTESLELTSCKLINTGIINSLICIQLGAELKIPLTCSLSGWEVRWIQLHTGITVKIRFPRGELIREIFQGFFSFCYFNKNMLAMIFFLLTIECKLRIRLSYSLNPSPSQLTLAKSYLNLISFFRNY